MSIDINLIQSDRLAPPKSFNDEEIIIWNRIVESFVPEYFDKSQYDLLKQYCQHVHIFDQLALDLADHIANGDREDEKQYLDKLKAYINIQNIQTKAVGQLAVKLRISNNSITNHDGSSRKDGAGPSAPWEFME